MPSIKIQENVSAPLHLFVSARHAPQIPNQNKPIHQLPDIEFIEALRCYNRYSKIDLAKCRIDVNLDRNSAG